MQIEWKGYYLDGRTAGRQQAAIRLMQSGLEATTETGTTLWWPYLEIRRTQGSYAGEQVRLERGGETPEVLLIPDTAFLADLHQVAPSLATGFYSPARRRMRAELTLIAGLAVIGISAALYLWGIPAMAALAAPHVPVAWEERLGEGAAEALAPEEARCEDPTGRRAIEEIMTALISPLPDNPYTFQVIVVNNPMVNALAAPGGYILVFRGLLEKTGSAEELAGVLAHEVQHVLRRHATRGILERASTGIILAALTGDASGAMAYGLESARTLGLLRYSRLNEEEADLEGMRMLLAAGIDPKGMIAFFETLKKEGAELPAGLKYLSTHPSTQDRIERLKLLAAKSPSRPAKLLPRYNWKKIRKMCQPPAG